jgi:hypothetical protein
MPERGIVDTAVLNKRWDIFLTVVTNKLERILTVKILGFAMLNRNLRNPTHAAIKSSTLT